MQAMTFGVRNVLTLLLLGWMLLDGYLRRGDRPLNWPMFTNHCAVVAELTVHTADGARTPVNMFQHLPAHAPWITPREFDALLAFLATTGSVHGSGIFYGNSMTYELEIADSRVAVTGTR